MHIHIIMFIKNHKGQCKCTIKISLRSLRVFSPSRSLRETSAGRSLIGVSREDRGGAESAEEFYVDYWDW